MTEPPKRAAGFPMLGVFLWLTVNNLFLKAIDVLTLQWWLVLIPLWIILLVLVVVGLVSLAEQK